MHKEEISFEAAIAELQAVVDQLEAGKVPLSDSLSLYERGMELVKLCNARLDDADRRVQLVRMSADGVKPEPFDGEVAP
jgi:exodeoxyribonuclease VII small subunit